MHAGAVTRRPRTLGLRTRVTLYFSLTALVASLFLSVVSYAAARSYLIDQRDEVARRQAFNNAQLVRTILRSRRSDAGDLIASVRTEGNGFAVLHLGPEDLYYPQDIRFTQDALPDELLARVIDGSTGIQRFSYDGEPYVAVGVNIAEIDVHYFETFSLASAERTLRILGTSLVIGTVVTTIVAATAGWYVSRRLLRPITRFADAAGGIAGGGLGTRLPQEDDPDLDRLARSFNDMADAVQTRIEREARFASDVSHELRSPITALSAAIEVLDARRDDLPDRTQQALDIVTTQVRRFDRMVLDLLELSRLDAGSTELRPEPLVVADLAEAVMRHNGFAEVPLVRGAGSHLATPIDKLRFERILVNLLQNAAEHAGGATEVRVERRNGDMLVIVEDEGPGVSTSERDRIFERFARGTAARHRVGTGLGLALVAEHAVAHGGSAWVEDAPTGGARFVVRFPPEDLWA
jgi:two-component system, OmpR family, sensor histidine kinase MtrB